MLRFSGNPNIANTRLRNLLFEAQRCARNECPKDKRAYLCMNGIEDEENCIKCWENYLEYIANGRTDHPYQYDLDLQIKQESLKVKEEGT